MSTFLFYFDTLIFRIACRGERRARDCVFLIFIFFLYPIALLALGVLFISQYTFLGKLACDHGN